MKIYVSLHPEPSAVAFELLKVFEDEARRRGVDVVPSTDVPGG